MAGDGSGALEDEEAEEEVELRLLSSSRRLIADLVGHYGGCQVEEWQICCVFFCERFIIFFRGYDTGRVKQRSIRDTHVHMSY